MYGWEWKDKRKTRRNLKKRVVITLPSKDNQLISMPSLLGSQISIQHLPLPNRVLESQPISPYRISASLNLTLFATFHQFIALAFQPFINHHSDEAQGKILEWRKIERSSYFREQRKDNEDECEIKLSTTENNWINSFINSRMTFIDRSRSKNLLKLLRIRVYEVF